MEPSDSADDPAAAPAPGPAGHAGPGRPRAASVGLLPADAVVADRTGYLTGTRTQQSRGPAITRPASVAGALAATGRRSCDVAGVGLPGLSRPSVRGRGAGYPGIRQPFGDEAASGLRSGRTEPYRRER